jgi:hypothetical protein
MNKMMTTTLAIGAGMAAYKLAKKNNLISDRQMNRLQKKVRKALS